jgi:hypothetical protein
MFFPCNLWMMPGSLDFSMDVPHAESVDALKGIKAMLWASLRPGGMHGGFGAACPQAWEGDAAKESGSV